MPRSLAKLLRTSAGRVALRYAVVLSLLMTVALAATHLLQRRYIDRDVAVAIKEELAQLVEYQATYGESALVNLIRLRVASTQAWRRRFYLLVDKDGRRLAGDLGHWPKGHPADGKVHNFWPEASMVDMEPEERSYWPGVAVEFDDGCRLLVAQSEEFGEEVQELIFPGLWIALMLTVVGAVIIGLRLGRELLDRADKLNEVARRVTAGDLRQRAPVDGSGDEFDELGRHLNTMLDNTERLLTSTKRVGDNIAHDMRRPISRVLNRLEVTLLTEDPEGYRQAIEETVSDLEGVMSTFDSLLTIARTEVGKARLKMDVVDLRQVAVEVAEFYEWTTDRVELEPGPEAKVRGEAHLIRQALFNLVDNALKFAPEGSPVVVSVGPYQDHCRLSVADRGPGIPAERQDFVLERFARLEESRSLPGSGLGLALVRAAAEAHRATLSFEDNRPGLVVHLDFPFSSAAVE